MVIKELLQQSKSASPEGSKSILEILVGEMVRICKTRIWRRNPPVATITARWTKTRGKKVDEQEETYFGLPEHHAKTHMTGPCPIERSPTTTESSPIASKLGFDMPMTLHERHTTGHETSAAMEERCRTRSGPMNADLSNGQNNFHLHTLGDMDPSLHPPQPRM